MALLVALMKLAHVFAGFWLVAGLVGRGVTQVRAERTMTCPCLGVHRDRLDHLADDPQALLVE